jgi:formylglycine-generating enzyme required for sulfatase activity
MVPDQNFFKNIVLDYSLELLSEAMEVKSKEENINRLGEMITIPEGEFIMGKDSGGWEARPQHSVCLPTYQIGKYEVKICSFRCGIFRHAAVKQILHQIAMQLDFARPNRRVLANKNKKK